jgi:hypothetical protein
MTLNIKITVNWHETPCSLVDKYQHTGERTASIFRVECRLHIANAVGIEARSERVSSFRDGLVHAQRI